MRFDRKIAVMVLATGVICGAAAVAGGPTGEGAAGATAAAPTAAATPAPTPAPAAPPPSPTARPRPAPKPKAEVGFVPWKAAELKPEHAILQGLVGKFTTKVRLYAGPYARLRDTEGTAEGKLLFGGPFVEVTHSEKRMKQPFDSLAIYGFDAAIGKYTADAVDNTSTAIVHFVGTYDAAKKQLVLSGRFSDQQSRTLNIVRAVTTFVDANTWTYEEYLSHAVGGPETQIVTITFTRS